MSVCRTQSDVYSKSPPGMGASVQSNAVRLFTPREANAMLPALRPLLIELADRHAEREQLDELLVEVE